MECGRREQETVINMKGNTCKIRSTAMVFSLGQVEMFIKGIIRKICEVDLGKCIGVMAATTRVNGSTEYNMDKGLFMCRSKALKRAFLETIHLSRFTKSSSFQHQI